MPDLGSAPALYASLPTLTVGGTAQPGLAQGLQSMLVEETTEGLYRCELTVANYGPVAGSMGFLYFDRQLLDFGTTLSIRAGAGAGAGTVFDGRISALEGRFFTE